MTFAAKGRAASLLGLLLAACSSDPVADGGAAGDGGVTSGDGGVTNGDGASADGAPGAPSTYCVASVAYYQRCGRGVTAACVDTKKQECVKEEAAYSAAYIKAATTCEGPSAACDPQTKRDCEARALAAATPTAVQVKLRDDYCKTCNPTSSRCATTFYTFGTGTNTDGLGYFGFVMNDATVGQMDAKCTGTALKIGNLRCQDAFAGCIQGIYGQAVLPIQTSCN
jgi:hypothetical protein